MKPGIHRDNDTDFEVAELGMRKQMRNLLFWLPQNLRRVGLSPFGLALLTYFASSVQHRSVRSKQSASPIEIQRRGLTRRRLAPHV